MYKSWVTIDFYTIISAFYCHLSFHNENKLQPTRNENICENADKFSGICRLRTEGCGKAGHEITKELPAALHSVALLRSSRKNCKFFLVATGRALQECSSAVVCWPGGPHPAAVLHSCQTSAAGAVALTCSGRQLHQSAPNICAFVPTAAALL